MNKLILVSFSFSRGGAALAASNFFSLIQSLPDISVSKLSQDHAGFFQFIKRTFSWVLTKAQFDNNPTKHSLNIFSYPPVIRALRLEKDSLFHFHWFNNDSLSILDLDKIPPYSIITLHDEWIYCGSEHYYNLEDPQLDFIQGYAFRKKGVAGIPWNYLIWKVKMKKISDRKDLIVTVPSTWMYQRASTSQMLKNAQVVILPNSIDTEVFTPSDQATQTISRNRLGIQSDNFVLTFGAIDGTKNPLKGSSILIESLGMVFESLDSTEKKKVRLVSFGGKKGNESILGGFPHYSLGHLSEKSDLAKIYSLSDLVVVPSRIESFGQVAAESLSCSTPVVCFPTSGLTDIVKDGHNGFYADSFSAFSLSEKIIQMIRMPKNERIELGERGREHVNLNFSRSVVREKYLKTLELAFSLKSGSDQ